MTDDQFSGETAKAGRIRDSRELSRYAVFCDGTLLVGEEGRECKVLDISSGGAHIRVDTPLESEGPFKLKINKCGELECKIVWQTDKKSGLLFFLDKPKEKEQFADRVRQNYAESGDQKRLAPRRSVIFPARAYFGNLIVDCRIKDISKTGAQVMFNEALNFSAPFGLAIKKFGKFSCDIAWREETNLGVTFLKTPPGFDHFVEHDLPKEN